MSLKNKKIILGVTGSIAAYKSVYIVRQLIQKNAEVRVIMTKSAQDFVAPLTFSTLSKHKVYIDFFLDESKQSWNNHVELGLWADIIIIAPSTAKTIAKASNGICDNFLLSVYLSSRCPVFFAPAMDLDMLNHISTQQNIQKIKEFGNYIIEPEFGELASGLDGKGRMAEPENIISNIESFFNQEKPLQGKNILITAGPTYEKIDPIRFIGNFSSGKMGFAIAKKAEKLGAFVILVTGPTSEILPQKSSIKRIDVVTSDEMYDSVKNYIKDIDIAVFSAAVSDYKPIKTATNKIKKTATKITINMTQSIDILKTIASKKRKYQIIIGFALETQNEDLNAQKKMMEKNCDYIVLNSLNDKKSGFKFDTNKVKIYSKDNKQWNFDLMSKDNVAENLWTTIIKNEKN